MWTVKYFRSKQYNWSGISKQHSLLAKAKRGLLQVRRAAGRRSKGRPPTATLPRYPWAPGLHASHAPLRFPAPAVHPIQLGQL